MTSPSITFRPSAAMLQGLKQRAAQLGVTLSDVVVDAVCQALGLPSPYKMRLLLALVPMITAHFTPQTFPADVTLVVFGWIRTDPQLRPLYDAAVQNSDGSVDPQKRAVLHRAIGRLVKVLLKARVAGRSPLLDPAVHLIESHALLAPVPPTP